jgi:tail assembly chaperone E/41/14-like protein
VNRPVREGFVESDRVDDDEELKRLDKPAPDDESAEDLPVAPDEPEWPMTIALLHRPIETKARAPKVSELTFREPTAGDIMRAGGNPCKVEIVEMGGGRVTWQPIIDDVKMIRLMASLSGVLEPYLQTMDPRDYASCAHRLRRFFLPEQGIW